MKLELEYRTEAEPQPRSSKKKTESAKEDFRKAALYLSGDTVRQIYSIEFMAMVDKTEFPFDFILDPDALPKQKPEKEPVMRMNQTALLKEFMRWVSNGELDIDSFEADDARLLKKRVYDALDDERKALARAKGQKVETGSVGDE